MLGWVMLGLTLTKVLHFQQVGETLGTVTELQQSHPSSQGGQAPTLPQVGLSAAVVTFLLEDRAVWRWPAKPWAGAGTAPGWPTASRSGTGLGGGRL